VDAGAVKGGEGAKSLSQTVSLYTEHRDSVALSAISGGEGKDIWVH
jgi:hypothetical protein